MTPVDTDPTDLGPDSDHLETARTDPAPPPTLPTGMPIDEQLRLEYLRRAVDADEERISRRTIPDCPDASGPNEPDVPDTLRGAGP